MVNNKWTTVDNYIIHVHGINLYAGKFKFYNTSLYYCTLWIVCTHIPVICIIVNL